MTTLQERFEKDFPNKSVKEIEVCVSEKRYGFYTYTSGGLDLSEYKNLTYLALRSCEITSINLPQNNKLMSLDLGDNKLSGSSKPRIKYQWS